MLFKKVIYKKWKSLQDSKPSPDVVPQVPFFSRPHS